ncbi:MAG: NfeD family protein [Lachnospiraceae bacterium]
MMDPLLWLVILAIFLIIEAVTVGLVTVWFAGGALACGDCFRLRVQTS